MPETELKIVSLGDGHLTCWTSLTSLHTPSFLFLFFMGIGVLHVCVSVWGCQLPWNWSYRQPYWCWELNSGPREEQSVLTDLASPWFVFLLVCFVLPHYRLPEVWGCHWPQQSTGPEIMTLFPSTTILSGGFIFIVAHVKQTDLEFIIPLILLFCLSSLG